jgi:hypothetical protein
MKTSTLTFVLLLCAAAAFGKVHDPYAPESTLDSNIAFYEGEKLNYVIYPPDGYHLMIDEAANDGYSFAFVPRGTTYDSAKVMIGVNIYKIRGMDFKDVLREDTAALRQHYGENVAIRPLDSVVDYSGDLYTAFYIDNKDAFIPNVMIAYFNGGSEMLIFELVISEDALRFKAEDVFISCLERLKAMPVGELGYK